MRHPWTLIPLLSLTVACGDPILGPDPDQPPITLPERAVSAVQDGSVAIDVSAIGPDGEVRSGVTEAGPIRYAVTGPSHGTLDGTGPMFMYRPAAGYVGSDMVEITISDDTHTVIVRFAITITARPNTAPVARDVDTATSEAQGVAITLAATDAETAVLTFSLASQPAHGEVTGVAPNLIYTPTGHFFGTDSFTYQASDGELSSNVATVVVRVDDVRTCGDGVIEGAEQCDDGNGSDTDGCLTNCMAASCGDGVVQAGVEQCDDVNGDDTDACVSCQAAVCGDGVVHAAVEPCDDGNDDPSDACHKCVPTRCGDGIVHVGVELCDDGNTIDTDACTTACTSATCGDGFVQAGEQCDDGNTINTDTCLSTCVASSCGDGFVQVGVEQCDDGNGDDTDACRSTCAAATCGDGFTHAGVEQCDDGNAVDTDACTSACAAAACGDGFTHAGVEACDDGNTIDTDACTSACAAAACGDGFTHAGVEACDDGNTIDTDACTSSCVPAACGDGIQASVEACDDGNTIDTDACTSSCVPAACGDGFTQAGVEQCDDGNADDTDACTSACVPAACGDGFTQAGVEECDDGGTDDGDGCGHSCQTERCGDGLTQFARGEQCDDGNDAAGDGCDVSCQVEPFTTTSAVQVSTTGAGCTTATANAARKVAVDGSGRIYAVMQCGTAAHVVVSADRGQTFSAPFEISAAIAGAVVAQAAVAAGPTGVAYAALMINTGEVYLRTSEDGGATWGPASLIGTATSTSTGLSLHAFNDDIYVGYSTSGGVAVARNHARGQGGFDTTVVGMSIAFFDLLYDIVDEVLVVAADTPGFHIRSSFDEGVSFEAEVNPPGQEFFSDWAIGAGTIYAVGTNLGASGDATVLYAIDVSTPSASTGHAGLPAVTTAQSRTVAADAAGNAFVASQLDGGGIQLDRFDTALSTFATPRSLGGTGTSPVVAPLPGAQGAVVVYADGGEVYVTVQAYGP
ncbi:MAG: DUF4215 domain-containing protein [Kofleriaceae bacterium]|nr:DUF4215 domain-containing protein [Kofleriaceae bacterium]